MGNLTYPQADTRRCACKRSGIRTYSEIEGRRQLGETLCERESQDSGIEEEGLHGGSPFHLSCHCYLREVVLG
jgi:hypothetical protein